MTAEKTKTQIIQYWYNDFQLPFLYIGLGLGYQKEELQDIISQFFLEFLEKGIDPKTIKNPKAYLSTAFRRRLIDYHRSTHKKKFLSTEEIKFSEPCFRETLEQTQSNAELVTLIKQAYQKLPERCQLVIYLKFYNNLTTDQIAAKTGLQKRTVYNNLYEGIKILRAELNKKKKGVNTIAFLSLIF